MAKTKVIFNEKAREKILAGVTLISDAVTTTLGPKGQNVLLERVYGDPIIVHDGVTVAEKIELEDDFENQAAMLVKQAAAKTNRETGDGTTTVTLLTSEMVKEGIKQISSGSNGMLLRKGMEIALEETKENLKSLTKPVGEDQWKDVATISAQDQLIGQKIAEAFKQVGKNGSIQVEEGAKEKIEIEHQDGMSIEKGYLSRHFATNYDSMQCILQDAMILVTDRNISSREELQAISNAYASKRKPIVVIAEGISPEILLSLIQSKLAGVPVVAVQAPEFGERRKSAMEDIALATGAKFISGELGMEVKSITADDFGSAKKVVVDNYSTLIIADSNKDIIAEKVTFLEKEIENTENEFDQEFIRKRIAKLTTGIAIIYAGGNSDVENREIRERINDAVGATRSAIQEGVVTGGAVTFYQLSKKLNNDSLTDDEKAGYNIVKKSLLKPMEKLLTNCGENPGKVMQRVEDLNDQSSEAAFEFGYNAYTGKIENLLESKILDPSKVLRVALENSVSVAGSLITTSCLVVDKQEKESKI